MDEQNKRITSRSLDIVTKLLKEELEPAEILSTLSLSIIAVAKGLGAPKEAFMETISEHWDGIPDPDSMMEQ